MKESFFIRQNKDKWKNLEKHLEQSSKDPDKLVDQFIQVSEDLSVARTFYNNRSVRLYLNDLVRKLYTFVYKSRRSNRKDILLFWKEELPKMMWESRRELALSFFTLVISIMIGVFSSIKDPHFTNTILGDSYVAMTEANIEKDDPMAVYKSMNELDMYFKITINNIRVDFITFSAGLLMGIGSILVTIYNGIMLGTFQFFFYEKGLLQESMLAIWLHGTLEIGGMVIATTAGLRLGSGLLFPGTYNRLQAFQRSAKQGFKILMGTLPITAFAAIIESFLTRYTDVGDWVRLTLILLSLVFLVGYFVIYPYRKSKTGFSNLLKEDKVPVNTLVIPDKNSIMSDGESINVAMNLFHKDIGKRLGWKLLIVVLASMSITVLYKLLNEYVRSEIDLFSFTGFIDNSAPFPMILITGIAWASILLIVQCNHAKNESIKVGVKQLSMYFINAAVAVFVFMIIFELPGFFRLIAFLGLSSIIMTAISISVENNQSIFTSFGPTFRYLKKNYIALMQMQFIMFVFGFVYFMLVNSAVVYIVSSFIIMNIPQEFQQVDYIETFINITMVLGALLFISPIFYWGVSWRVHSFKEANTASHLIQQIRTLWS
ncbi:MAG: stage II sporulation protein M [Cytophagaceae bacterium]